MKKTKKALASLAIAGMVLSMAPMSVFGADTSNRISDLDRVGTAIAIANDGWTASDSVIVVPADDANIVDALAAAPLAGQLDAPILVTYKGALDSKVQQKIVDLKAKNVYAIGALSADVVNSLKAISGVTVTQLQGTDRVDTAAKVAGKLTDVKGSFVVAYDGKADALSAASYAAANDYSIVIANPDGTVPTGATLGAKVYTVGGQVTVAGATALKGADRYATNNAVLDGLEYKYDKVYVANGQTLVDALAGAPLAAKTNSPIVLGDAVGVATGANDNLTTSSQVIALGGTGAVSDTVLAKIKHQVPAKLAVASVSSPNAKTLEVKFNKAVDEDTVISDDLLLESELVTVTALSGATDISDATLLEAEATLSDDGMTLTLVLPLEDGSEIFDGDYVIAVSKEIEDVDSNEGTKYSAIHKFEDAERPTISGPAYPTNNSAKFTFSEPINATEGEVASALSLKDKDGDSEVVSVDLADDKKSFKLSTAALDEDETYTLRVIGLADFAGNLITPNPKTFDVVKKEADTTKPTVSSISAINIEGMKVTFSEALDEDVDFAVYVDGTEVAVDEYDFNDDGNEVEVTFASDVLEGLHTVKLVGYTDLSGNEGKTYSKIVKFTQDDVAPTVESTTLKTIDGTRYVVVQYNEDVVLDTVPAVVYATYVDDSIEKNLEIVAEAFTINPDDDAQLLIDTENYDGDGTKLPKGAYTIKLTAAIVEDLQGNNAAAKSVKVTVGSLTDSDKTEPEVEGTVEIVNNDTIKVYYSEDMDTASALNVGNYTVEGVRVFESAVFVGDKTTVKLTLKDGGIDETGKRLLQIKDVKDEAGNVIDAYKETVTLKENVNPVLESAEIVDLATLELTFSEDIRDTSLDVTDFKVTIDGTEVAVAGVSVDDDVVTLTLGGSISSLDDVVKVKLVKGSVADLAGNTNADEVTVTAK